MNKKLIIPKRIVTANSDGDILRNVAVEIIDSEIVALLPVDSVNIKDYNDEVYSYPELTLIPGFIQTHVHLCQTLFRGMADDLQLLDWLKQKIFPLENAHNENSLKYSVRLGINELLMGGTTTILDMGTLRHQEVVFDEMIKSGVRGFSGKCLIDENDLFPDFKADTDGELRYMNELAKDFHNSADRRIKYGFAPRFVLSCSEGLLKETAAMMNDFEGSIYHTHSSENKDEIAEVRRRYSKENIEYFESIDVLNDHTVLAHCIHVSDNEKKILKNNNVRVAHCPSSNLKLGSGIANIPDYLERGISVSLGADGSPCNNNLSVFIEMRLCALIQKPIYGADVMDAKTVFNLATIEGAKALHLENEIGSIEVGKKADLSLIDLNNIENPVLDDDEQIYSNIVYSSGASSVKLVMIDGNWVVKDGGPNVYDNEELISKSKDELNLLLKRL